MRRFITYLYAYHGGKKLENVGFARIDQRSDKVHMKIQLKYLRNMGEAALVYVLVWDKELYALELGRLMMNGGTCEEEYEFAAENILDSGYDMDAVTGIAIVADDRMYLASCWKDELAEAIAGGNYHIWNMRSQEVPESVGLEDEAPEKEDVDISSDMQVPIEMMNIRGELKAESREPEVPTVKYRKIELNEIRLLPRRNWRLCGNRFVIHGFFNYGYLVVATEIAAGVETSYLGVPGIYEKPEMVAAAAFDFLYFIQIPPEVSEAKKEEVVMHGTIKDHNPKEGTLGLWLSELYM